MASAATSTANASSKRRSCDECRTRKLACTKESEGCSRCLKENIKCTYSEQKAMGRPRKRRRSNGVLNEGALPNPLCYTPPELEHSCNHQSFQLPNYPDAGSLPFATHTNGGSAGSGAARRAEDRGQATITPDQRTIWHFGSEDMVNPAINFDAFDPVSSLEHEQTMPSAFTEPIEVSTSMANGNQTFPVPRGSTCSCLAAMYLSMAALQELSNDVVEALSVVRNAAQTARNTIRCSICTPCLTIDPDPAVSGFQNTMLLGTILPLIVNGYKRLLVVIDEETRRAALAGQKKHFKLEDYGGILHADPRGRKSNESQSAHGELSPGEWRVLVRALLRVDLYGYDESMFGITGRSAGLMGIVTELEERQKKRHYQIDQLRDAGLWTNELENIKCSEEQGSKQNQRRLCLQMIEAAKQALDALVIA